MEKRLEGKTAIVTGAGNGIGRAIAEVFGGEGARILVVDIDEEAGNAAVDKVTDAGGEASFFEGDVSRLEDMEAMAEEAAERYGEINILCANAGIFPEAPLEEMEEEAWDRVLNVNLKGAFLAVKACLPHMIEQETGGRILFTSSITGNRTAIPGLAHYAASKGGINGFIKGAAVELAKYNITVNGVEPGNILTEGMDEQLGEDYIEQQESMIPMGKLGDPADIAYAMLFLASYEAKYITGQTMIVDGGQILPESKSMD